MLFDWLLLLLLLFDWLYSNDVTAATVGTVPVLQSYVAHVFASILALTNYWYFVN